jgi:hypothetical protein
MSELAEHRFYELKGQSIIIDLDDRPSAEMRRYFEGAVVVSAFYQSVTAWQDFKECREALKLEFLPGWTRDLKGRQVQYPRSTSELSKEGFRGFLGRIEVWFLDCGFEWPDAEAYRAWRDSGPMKGDIYPPVARLKAAHEAKRAKAAPWLRRS